LWFLVQENTLLLGLLLENSAHNERRNTVMLPVCATDINIAEMVQEQPKAQYHHL
jgi:hypothetical protein